MNNVLARWNSLDPVAAAREILPCCGSGAWATALAVRERRWPAVVAACALAGPLALLLAFLHGFDRRVAVAGVLLSVFILVLTAAATLLLTRMEGASLFAARWRWHRARRAYEAADRSERADMEAAEIARRSWLGVVRTWASSACTTGRSTAGIARSTPPSTVGRTCEWRTGSCRPARRSLMSWRTPRSITGCCGP